MNMQFDPKVLSMMAESFGYSPSELASLMDGSPEKLMSELLLRQSASDEEIDDKNLADELDSIEFKILDESNTAEPPTLELVPEPAGDQTPNDEELQLAFDAIAAEHEAADGLLQYISEVSGACSRCFGTDRKCHECGGNGAPGHSPSRRPQILAQWIGRLSRAQNNSTSSRQSLLNIDQGEQP